MILQSDFVSVVVKMGRVQQTKLLKKGQAAATTSKNTNEDNDSDSSSDSRSSGFLTNDSTIEPSIPLPVATKSLPPPVFSPSSKRTARKSFGGKAPRTVQKSPVRRTLKPPTVATPKTPSKSPAVKTPRKFRYRPGTRALKEIRRYQQGTGNLIPRLPFARLIREIASKYM